MKIQQTKSANIVKSSRELIDSLLSINTNNRGIKNSVVSKYRRDIREGNWHFTNQGIGVYEDNTLADGQHRLVAIQKEGYPEVEFLLVTGLKKDAGIAIDQHAKRSIRDVFQFAFNERVHYHAPAVANILFIVNRNWQGGGSTSQELFDIIHDYSHEMEVVLNTPKSKNFYSAPYLAGFITCLRENPTRENEIISFILSVESGELLKKTDPEFHLRNCIVIATGHRGSATLRKERFLKTIKATQARIEGKEMLRLLA